MDDIQKLHLIGETAITPKSSVYRAIMRNFPNALWNYPLYMFLFKHGKVDKDKSEISLDKATQTEFEMLVENTVRFCLTKCVAYNTLNSIKTSIYKACVAIAKGENYIQNYEVTVQDKEVLKAKILGNDISRYQRCLVLLAAYLNRGQKEEGFLRLFDGKYDIEHILPKKGFNNFDGWTLETYKVDLGKLGNLVPFTRELNISAGNSFFEKKKVEYEKENNLQDIKDLLELVKWTPVELEARDKEIIERLKSFFAIV